MGYGLWIMGGDFVGNQLGSTKKLWNRGEYGLWELWIRGESTVIVLLKQRNDKEQCRAKSRLYACKQI